MDAVKFVHFIVILFVRDGVEGDYLEFAIRVYEGIAGMHVADYPFDPFAVDVGGSLAQHQEGIPQLLMGVVSVYLRSLLNFIVESVEIFITSEDGLALVIT